MLKAQMKKLFIYIPTYNRLHSLVMQLNALLPQLEAHPNVRLHINDNASSVLDVRSLSTLIARPSVAVTQNGSNIGANANILLGFTHWQADEALWILSDNDIVLGNAVERILAAIESDADLIRMSSDGVIRESTYHWDEGWSDEISKGTGLISAIIYNSAKFKPHVSAGFFYHNTSFPHLAIILSCAREFKSITFSNIERLIAPQHFAGDERGDYSLSQLGMPLLTELMPNDKAIEFCKVWLGEWLNVFFSQREKHPSVFAHCFNYMRGLSSELHRVLDR
jgi:hypothetical protein